MFKKLIILSFGSWINCGTKINEDEATKRIAHFYENGINFFDNAEVYEYGISEVIMSKKHLRS